MRETFEKAIFKYTLVLALLYQLYQTLNALLSGATTIVLNLTITVCLTIVLLLSWKIKDVNYLAFCFHLAILPVLIYFWINFGGLLGTVPIILFAYTSWIILSLRGWQQLVILSIYLIVFIILTEFPQIVGLTFSEKHILSTTQLSIDFLVITLIITTFLLFLKTKFVTYRKRIEGRNKELQESNINVARQVEQLRNSQEEIKSINDNLEKIIEQRIQNIELKSKELEEYAFINAHLVRGPLCRIIGLTMSIEREEKNNNIGIIRQKAEQVDIIIKKINDITS
jgi:signal transduction histidine kinase